MKAKLLGAAVVVGLLLTTAGPATAQVYYSQQGNYYYPSTSGYYYPSTGGYPYSSSSGYYYPSTGTYTYGSSAYTTPGVVQSGATYYVPMDGTAMQNWTGMTYQSYGYAYPYDSSGYQTYGYSYPNWGYSDYGNSNYGYGTYGTGAYLNVSPWGVNYGYAPGYNRTATWGRMFRR